MLKFLIKIHMYIIAMLDIYMLLLNHIVFEIYFKKNGKKVLSQNRPIKILKKSKI